MSSCTGSISNALKELEMKTCAKISEEIEHLFSNIDEIVNNFLYKKLSTEKPSNICYDLKPEAEERIQSAINFDHGSVVSRDIKLSTPSENKRILENERLLHNSGGYRANSHSDVMTSPDIEIETMSENEWAESYAQSLAKSAVRNSDPTYDDNRSLSPIILATTSLSCTDKIRKAKPTGSIYQCAQCTFSTTNKYTFKKHRNNDKIHYHLSTYSKNVPTNSHSSSSIYQCKNCNYFTPYEGHFARHLRVNNCSPTCFSTEKSSSDPLKIIGFTMKLKTAH